MDPVEQATSAAAAAARQSDQYALVLAAVQAAQIVQQQQPQNLPVCQHHHQQQRPEFDARKWVVIGGLGIVGALAFALVSIAIAIGACCCTLCALVLRSMWRDFQRGR